MIQNNSEGVCKNIFIVVFQPPDWNNKIAILEMSKFIDMIMMAACIIYRAWHMSINVLPPFLHMVNFRDDPIWWNLWVAMNMITY